MTAAARPAIIGKTAASLLLAKKNAGITLGGLFGVTLMLWIRIQFYMFPLNFMSTIYFMFGFAQAAPVRARRSAACQKSPITIDIVLLRMGGRLCPPGRLHCFYGNLRRIRNFQAGRCRHRPLQSRSFQASTDKMLCFQGMFSFR